MLNSKEEAAAAPKHKVKVDYEIGDAVKVLEGPFASFNGVVEELDFDKSKVKVSVSIFGRATPWNWTSSRSNARSKFGPSDETGAGAATPPALFRIWRPIAWRCPPPAERRHPGVEIVQPGRLRR